MVIRCSIERLIRQTFPMRILHHTLNLGNYDLPLDQRRVELRNELFVSKKTYGEMEADAYLKFS